MRNPLNQKPDYQKPDHQKLNHNQLCRHLYLVSGVLCGVCVTGMPAQTLSLQDSWQLAEVVGDRNRIHQQATQLSIDIFDVDAYIRPASQGTQASAVYFDLSNPTTTFFGEFSQLNLQAVAVEGNQNRVFQWLEQTMVNLFLIDGQPLEQEDDGSQENAVTSLNTTVFADQISGLEETFFFEQFSDQASWVSGIRNRVAQVANQTQLNLYLFDADFSALTTNSLWALPPVEVQQESVQQKLVEGDRNVVTQTLTQDWIELPVLTATANFELSLTDQLSQYLKPDLIEEIITAWLEVETESDWNIPAEGFALNQPNSATVPEPNSLLALIGIGLVGGLLISLNAQSPDDSKKSSIASP